MNKVKKKLLGLSIAVCTFSLAGAMLSISSPKEVSASTESLKMIPGAAVRLQAKGEDEAINGLRFEAQMTKDHYQGLQGAEVVLSSAATANEKTYEVTWVLKSEEDASKVEVPAFDSDGIAKFYHTITFDSLFQNSELLRQANALEFECSFRLDSDEDSEDWESGSETRSMRQVAYKAYNTPGTTEDPNIAYQDETLLHYFTASETDNEKVYSVGESDEDTVETAVGAKAYADYDGMFVDVSNKAMGDLYGREAEYVVVFNENNVASKTPIKWPDEMISTAERMSALLTEGTTKEGEYYVLENNIYIPELTAMAEENEYTPSITFKGILDGNGYALYAPQRRFGLFGNIESSAVVKNMKIVVDVSSADNLLGNLNQSVVLGVKANGTFDNLYVKMIGDGTKIQKNGFSLFNHDIEEGTFKDLVLDYADMLPVAPSKLGDRTYNSLFGISGTLYGTAENIHAISTTCNAMSQSYTGNTVDDYEWVTLHSDMTTVDKELLSDKYWDTTGTALVWKKDEVVDNNQVLWSVNTNEGYGLDGLFSEGETVETVKEVVSDTICYENGEWKNTSALLTNVGEEAPVLYYKTLKVVGSEGTEVTTIAKGYNRVIAKASDMQFLASAGSTFAGKYIMVDNVTVDAWDDDSATTMSAINFNGVFDGNGYTLSTPQRLYGLFGTVGENAIVKNVRMNVTARGSKINNIVISPAGNQPGVLLAYEVYGTFENMYVQVSGSAAAQGIGLVGRLKPSSSLKNFVVDYGTVYKTGITSGQFYKGYLTVASYRPEAGATLQNVYAIGENNDKTVLYERGSNVGLNYHVYAENERPDGELDATYDLVLTGVRRYNNVEAVETDTTAGKDLTGFDATYWDTTSGAPVWKNKA